MPARNVDYAAVPVTYYVALHTIQITNNFSGENEMSPIVRMSLLVALVCLPMISAGSVFGQNVYHQVAATDEYRQPAASSHFELQSVSDWDTLINPTSEWIDIYCDGPTLNGTPLEPGDTILAYDPDGILCGVDTVRADGLYGFMPVYKDDFTTEEDEGCDPGDTIQFEINGTPVIADPPVVWTERGARTEVCAFRTVQEELHVFFDIKPGSCPNPLNVKGNFEKGKAVLPVAILGTDDFDVREIDPSTVTLNGVSPARWNFEDAATPYTDDDECGCHEEYGDGFEDLTLKFYRADIIHAIAPVEDRDFVELVVSGSLGDGTDFVGSDCVWILGDYAGAAGNLAETTDESATLKANNFPNPFNPSTTISLQLPVSGSVRLSVYNLLGQEIHVLFDGELGAGSHEFEWRGDDAEGRPVASGIYFYRVVTADREFARKMLLMK